MNKTAEFSDEQLTAYLDGEMDYIPADDIRAALKHDPELQARLDRLSVDKAALATAFNRLLDASPQAPDFSDVGGRVRDPAWAVSWRRLAAVLVVGLGVGWTFALFSRGGELETWRDYVAAYHALYAEDTLAAIDRPTPVQTDELARISGLLGKPLDLTLLTDLPELEYKRAQILGYEGEPLAQMTFLSTDGVPIALCIIRQPDGENVPVTLAEMEGMASASWSSEGYDYLLIGGKDQTILDSVAGKLQTTL